MLPAIFNENLFDNFFDDDFMMPSMFDGKYIRRERYEGQCSRSFYVGESVQAKDVNAKFEDGILKVSVPKAAPQVETDNVIAIE